MSLYARLNEALYAVGLDIKVLDELLYLAISEHITYNDVGSCGEEMGRVLGRELGK